MKKILLTNISRTTCSTVPKCYETSASSVLKREKKLYAKSLTILICVVQIFSTSQQDICA